MGRITVFTANHCPHSRRLLKALARHRIPYKEINVTLHPHRIADMLSLCNNVAVPQAFFNTRYVGGVDQVDELLEGWVADANNPKKKSVKKPLDRYKSDIEKFPDPANPKLALPSPEEDEAALAKVMEQLSTAASTASAPKITLPKGDGCDNDNTALSVREATELLKQILPCSDLSYNLTRYSKSFKGTDAVKALVENFDVTPNEAETFAQRLQHLGLLHHVTDEHVFKNKGNYYRLHCYHSPQVLNSYRVWTLVDAVVETLDAGSNSIGGGSGGVPDLSPAESMRCMHRLMDMFGRLENDATDADDSCRIDYSKIRSSARFLDFEEAACELQAVDLGRMDDTAKTAFGVNLWNLMTRYAYVKLGVPDSSMARNAFYSGVKVNVGGHVYSLEEFEHGIIRGNRKAPFALSQPLSKTDPRIGFAVGKPDYRIHFAINRCSRSSPPVFAYSSDNLDDELRWTALAFCDDDNHVSVDTDKDEVRLLKIFEWYESDFVSGTSGGGSNGSALLNCVAKHLHGLKKQALEKVLFNKKKESSVNVSYLPYDWSLPNVKGHATFDPTSIIPNRKTVRALLG